MSYRGPEQTVRCAYMGEDGTDCGRAAVGDGMCATHTTHLVVTEHPDQPLPTPNDKPALWPMVMKGWLNSAENLDAIVKARMLECDGSHEELMRRLYLTTMITAACIARIAGRSVEQVYADMNARHEFGVAKYKTPLQPWNGRDATKDAYDELLDGLVYMRQKLFELGLKED